jgi:hypothetical protein
MGLDDRGQLKALNRLIMRQSGDQVANGCSCPRITPFWRQISQRPQDEAPAGHTRMGQDRLGRSAGGDLSFKINKIQIDQTGSIRDGAEAPESFFDSMKLGQQLVSEPVR